MTRWVSFAGLLASSLVFCACIPPWRQELIKTETDMQNLREQARERANSEACAKTAMPGSMDYLECQLALTKKEQAPPPAKAPAKP